jgi:hypothetical protein
MYKVLVSKRILKRMERMPGPVQARLAILIEQLLEKGPLQPGWANYGKLGPNKYHCHLSRDWVACWYWRRGTKETEVYYVGSRQDALY